MVIVIIFAITSQFFDISSCRDSVCPDSLKCHSDCHSDCHNMLKGHDNLKLKAIVITTKNVMKIVIKIKTITTIRNVVTIVVVAMKTVMRMSWQNNCRGYRHSVLKCHNVRHDDMTIVMTIRAVLTRLQDNSHDTLPANIKHRLGVVYALLAQLLAR